jgi:KipI family sensor histidine kinase inhibitor
MLKYIPSGDSAFIIKAGDTISEEVNQTVRRLLVRLEDEKIIGITDFIPSYNELMVCYDPLVTGYRQMVDALRASEADLDMVRLPDPFVVHVPVLYGGGMGPDLQYVAEYCDMSPDDVIRIHTSASYLVYMLGFTPGFCYLGGMDQRIATPRKESPRLKITAGAVGIADRQTGIYPVESPGGWQLIGRTPLRLFMPDSNTPFLFRAGDYIRFYPVTEEEYNNISSEVGHGTWEVKRTGVDRQ